MKKLFMVFIFMVVSSQFLSVFGYNPPNPVPSSWDQQIDGEYISTPIGWKRGSYFQDTASYESIAIDVYQYNSKAHYEVILERYNTNDNYVYRGGGNLEIKDGQAMIEFHPQWCDVNFDYGESCVSSTDCLDSVYYHDINFDDKSLFYQVKLYYDLYLKDFND